LVTPHIFDYNIGDVESLPAHPYIAILELVRPFDHRMMT